VFQITERGGGVMDGKRVEPKDGDLILRPGEYGINPKDGNWYACTPSGDMGNLAEHHAADKRQDGDNGTCS